MSIKVIIAPAGSGKTTWAVKRSRGLAAELMDTPRVIVPSRVQAMSFRGRLAQAGGAIGVRVGTFEDLSQEILDLAEIFSTRISETTQIRLLQNIVENCSLDYYGGIKTLPGFIQIALKIIRELKAGGIRPSQFAAAVKGMGGELRLSELAKLYSAYQKRLQDENWADYIGEVWLAAEALESNSVLCSAWKFLLFDGFDDLSPIQLRIIQALKTQVSDLTITLTGTEDGITRPLVHKRFQRIIELLADVDTLEIIHLEENGDRKLPDALFSRLESNLFRMEEENFTDSNGVLQMAAVPDREAEVRFALRWIKSLIVKDKFHPGQTALLMRNLESYRPIIIRVASEYGIPVQVQGGVSLIENPAIAALFDLLKATQPGKEQYNWRAVVEAWRSPYFSWDGLREIENNQESVSTHLNDTDQLVQIARWGSVIQGYQQWEEVFSILIERSKTEGNLDREGVNLPSGIVFGDDAARLWEKFQDFIRLLTPPSEKGSVREFVSWMEDLLGDEQAHNSQPGLEVIQKIKEGPPDLAQRDLGAIRTLNSIFREMVWAEKAMSSKMETFSIFLENIDSIIKRTSYQPEEYNLSAVYCADISESRGIHFRAAAILGLAEGEFPQTLKEDPFLRDGDRKLLREEYGLPIRQSTDSAEAEYFYESVTRASSALLITRPRIADNGAPWQPSPYWEEILRCVNVEPLIHTSRTRPDLDAASSKSEFFEIISTGPEYNSAWRQAEENQPETCSQIIQALSILTGRTYDSAPSGSIYDGRLTGLGSVFSERYPAEHVWSASRLETYQTCPFYFFVANVLGLERIEPPREGLDARQLGNIYHHILEDLYQEAGDRSELKDLQNALPKIARKVFDQAPRREGFRKTAWWLHTQKEILTNLERCLIVLETLDPSFVFFQAEQKFGIGKFPEPPLRVEARGGEFFFLRGFIDRVDINETGKIRIIDYKTSASYGFTHQAVREGKKLQLPLYALAAQSALKLGMIQEGFYFHVRSAETSGFKLSSFKINGKKGPSAAMENAVDISWRAVQAVREGSFKPKTPNNGCPDYCPAADFCWHYRPKRW